MKVDMELLPMKAHYFFMFAGTAPVLPFLPVYARQQGISPTGIGLIYTILPFIGLFAKSASGALADLLRIHRAVFLSAIAVCALGFFSIYFTPPIPQTPNDAVASITFDCSSPSSYIRYCSSKEKCRQSDFINGIKDNYTSTCQVKCIGDAETFKSVCDDWNVSTPCVDTVLNFTATTNLFHNDQVHPCTFFPISNITIDGTEVIGPVCPDQVKLNCSVACDDAGFMAFMDTPLSVPPSSLTDLLSLHQFWLYLLCVIIAWSGLAVSVVMSDTLCFQLLGEKANKYGEQRMFGSLGWGTLVVITGLLIDYASQGEVLKDYTSAFVLSLAVLFLDLLAATRLQIKGDEKKSWTAGALARLICEPQVVLFVVCCVVVGISTGILWTFLLMLVEDIAFEWDCHFENMKLLQGLIMGVQCFGGEIPFFFISGWFIKKLGHVHAMSLVIAVFGIRYILYYTISNPWVFLPVELLNGFTFGIFYATMTSYASLVAPSGTEATMQGIVGAAFEGIGIAVGGFVGGALFFTVGGSKTFLYTGIFNILFAVLHIILQILLKRIRPETASSGGSPTPVGYMVPSESMKPVAATDADPEED